MASNVTFDILARDRASQTFDKVGMAAQRSGSIIGKVGKSMAVAAGTIAVGGITALGVAMVQGVKDAADYQTLAAKTAAVLKSTGNVAHQSVKGIQARAAALESLSGVDETIIINGQNVLATFTKVRDGVGKGNDIFNQATKAALNLSTALGTDMQSASILVGKALNDPVRGLTALRRAGVSFTQSQQDQIKALVESGHTMQAQKIILKELGTEFGGAAAAAGQGFNGAMARARDAVSDAFRAIGMQLLPTITKLANFIAANAGPAIAKLGIGIKAMVGAFQEGDVTSTGFVGVMERIGAAAHVVWGAVTNLRTTLAGLGPVLLTVGAAVISVAGFLMQHKTATMAAVSAMVALVAITKLHAAVLAVQAAGGLIAFISQIRIVAAVTKTWAAVQWLMNAALTANPIGIIIVAIAALTAGIIYAYKHSQTFRNVVNGALQAVGRVGLWLWNSVFQPVIHFIVAGFASIAAGIGHMLVALGRVPGFGWAKTAGQLMLGAAQKAQTLANNIRKIPNKHVTVTVSVHAQTGRLNVGGQRVNIGQFASGTSRAPKGWAWVGEQGPELMNLKGGEQIIPADQSMAIASARSAGATSPGMGGTTIIVNINGPAIGTPSTIAQQIHQALLKYKNQQGTALGLV
jgi:hypothetical protein